MKLKTKILVNILIAAFCLAPNLNAQQWEKVSDTTISPAIHKIFFPYNDTNMVVVASDDIPMDLNEKEIQFYDQYSFINGKGYSVSYDKGVTFTEKHLDGFFVYEFAQDPNNPDKWMAAARNDGK